MHEKHPWGAERKRRGAGVGGQEWEREPGEDKLARSGACRKSSARHQCGCTAGCEAAEAQELGIYNDCHNSAKHDHGAGMVEYFFPFLNNSSARMCDLCEEIPRPNIRRGEFRVTTLEWRTVGIVCMSPIQTFSSICISWTVRALRCRMMW